MDVCSSESNFNYEAEHKGKFDKYTIGKICGLNRVWIYIIPEINKDNINTLYAGSLVIDYLLKQYKGNLFLAMKHFKGAEKNLKPVKKVITIIRRKR